MTTISEPAYRSRGSSLALRYALRELRGDERADATRVLYGGSVSNQNVAGFMRQPDVDGALVGGASLKSDEFTRIIQFKKHVTGS